MSRYVRIEDWRFRSNAVGSSALRFYGILRSFCRTDTTVRGDMDAWASAAGISKSAAKKLMTELVKAGPEWVARKSRGEYSLSEPPDAREGQQSGPSESCEGPKSGPSRTEIRAFEGQQSGPSHHTQGTTKNHEATRDARSLSLDEHRRRVEAIDPAAMSSWARRFLDVCRCSLGKGRTLSAGRLAKLEELELEAAAANAEPKEVDRWAAMAERSRRERAERDAAIEAVLRERGLAA